MRRFFRLSAPILLLIASGADTAPSDAPATTPDPPAATPSTPTVLDGIKYTNLEQQGSLTRETCRTLGIPTIPIAYHGGVDTNADGMIEYKEWLPLAMEVLMNGMSREELEAARGIYI